MNLLLTNSNCPSTAPKQLFTGWEPRGNRVGTDRRAPKRLCILAFAVHPSGSGHALPSNVCSHRKRCDQVPTRCRPSADSVPCCALAHQGTPGEPFLTTVRTVQLKRREGIVADEHHTSSSTSARSEPVQKKRGAPQLPVANV